MKKFVAVLLVIAAVIALAGCDVQFDKDAVKDQIQDHLQDQIDDAKDQLEDQIQNQIDGVKQEAANGIDRLLMDIGVKKTTPEYCSHTPKEYNEARNTVLCACGETAYAELNYKDFQGTVPFGFWHFSTWGKDKHEYCANKFAQYRGVDPALITMLDKLDLDSDYTETLSKLDEIIVLMNNVRMGAFVLANAASNADQVTIVQNYDTLLGNALTITRGLIHLHQMLDEDNDPFEACDAFIETVKAPVSLLNGPTGIHTAVGLNSLQTALSAFQLGYEERMKFIDFAGLATKPNTPDGQFAIDWTDLGKSTREWKNSLKYEHVMGTEKPDLDVPTLAQICAIYPTLGEDGKAFAGQYIIFCLDLIFEETLGISYTDYVKYLSN